MPIQSRFACPNPLDGLLLPWAGAGIQFQAVCGSRDQYTPRSV